jgi:HPt (histidine-containing phosphotransfer) domain-containing protein
LKGSASNLGAKPMANLCLTMEKQAKQGDLTGMRSLLEQLEARAEAVRQILEEEKKK